MRVGSRGTERILSGKVKNRHPVAGRLKNGLSSLATKKISEWVERQGKEIPVLTLCLSSRSFALHRSKVVTMALLLAMAITIRIRLHQQYC